jgi:hypothetical protein
MSKTIKKETLDGKLMKDYKNLLIKYESRKQQVGRLKNVIRELEKEREKLIQELSCYKKGIEYKPKDISRPKKLTPDEKKKVKELTEKDKKAEVIKKMKEKFGRKNNENSN